ncbi:hypothetical protein V490_04145 [Pseudogymnoascus sp. VKM F-3557]|nr:hypothetical protein V490_04145 [Pseudogymnoascus sp. VKM F-3557]
MPNVLSKWIDKKLSRPKSDETPEQLPFLPQRRPRVLTPSPSRESLVLSAEAATSNSAFFQKLPTEIRRKILKEAFGMFAMHMHLSLEYPRIPIKDRTPQDLGRHARISYIPNTWEAQKPPKRFGIPKQKTWQCYAEGIDVLYSTNRIHFSTQFMVLHLPQLLLPQRLASITSVELVWNVRLGMTDAPIPPNSWGLPDLHSLMDVVVSSLTGLQYLSLTLDCDIDLDPKGNHIDQDEQNPTISNPIDDFVRRLRPRLLGCDIAIPQYHFEIRKGRSEPTEEVWDVRRRRDDKRLWRELPHTDDGEHEALPMNQRGYWVACGRFHDSGMVCMAF